jgi:hypothetical protein
MLMAMVMMSVTTLLTFVMMNVYNDIYDISGDNEDKYTDVDYDDDDDIQRKKE